MCIHFQFIIVSDLNLAIWVCPQTSAVDANDAGFQTIAGIECVRLRFTLILAQASCVDSVPLSSFTSMEPRYCEKTNKQTLRRIQTYVRVWLWLLNSRSLPLTWAGRVLGQIAIYDTQYMLIFWNIPEMNYCDISSGSFSSLRLLSS